VKKTSQLSPLPAWFFASHLRSFPEIVSWIIFFSIFLHISKKCSTFAPAKVFLTSRCAASVKTGRQILDVKWGDIINGVYSKMNEIVLYQPNAQFQLEVQVKDNTVWLTQQQIADLFGVKQPAISKHLANIFKEGELDKNSVHSILEYTAADGKVYSTQFYNLDAILSVGYRVNSKNATLFRRWANSVLNEYILRGHAVNQQLMYMEQRINRRFQEHTEQIHELQDKVDFFVRAALPPIEQVFFEGQFFEARVLLEKIIKMAKKRVIIIDPYIDAATFEMLDVRAKDVSADIYSDGEYKTLRDAHNASNGKQPVNTHKWSNSSHDRWVIIDDTLYHCGHSVKDLGKKLSAIMRMDLNPEVILNQVR